MKTFDPEVVDNDEDIVAATDVVVVVVADVVLVVGIMVMVIIDLKFVRKIVILKKMYHQYFDI